MIASVQGVVGAIAADHAVVEVGGVGLAVQCGPATLAGLRQGDPVKLATSLIVREDSLTLYGFADDAAKAMFELLQTASGVGPRVAQSALAVLSTDAIRAALHGGDVSTLTRIPGVGKKGAERLILELRDKVGPVTGGGDGAGAPVAAVWHDQVRQGLVGLGWSAAQAESAVNAVAETVDGTTPPPIPVLLRHAIRLLGKAR